jgi:hypothetical protein
MAGPIILQRMRFHRRRRNLEITKLVSTLVLIPGPAFGMLSLTAAVTFATRVQRDLTSVFKDLPSYAWWATLLSAVLLAGIAWAKSRPFRKFVVDAAIALLLLSAGLTLVYAFSGFAKEGIKPRSFLVGSGLMAWALFHVFVEIVWLPAGRFIKPPAGLARGIHPR